MALTPSAKRPRSSIEPPGEQSFSAIAPPREQWPHDAILAAARRVMGDPRAPEERLRAIAQPGEFRSFFEAYPKLFQVCSRAVTAQDRASVEQHLGFMLSSIAQSSGNPEFASKTVHSMLTERYINPVAQLLAEQQAAAESAAGGGGGEPAAGGEAALQLPSQ